MDSTAALMKTDWSLMICVLDVFGQGCGDFFQALLDFVRGGDGVLAGLLGDHEGDGGHAIEARGTAGLFVAVLGIADVAHFHDVAVAGGDGDLVELRGIGDAAGGAHGEFAGSGVEVAAGQFEVLLFERVEDVGDGEVVGAEAYRGRPGRGFRAWLRRGW